MKCKTFQKHLFRLMDGEIEASLAKDLEEHQAQCPRCAAFRHKSETMLNAVDSLPKVTSSEAFDEGFKKKLDQALRQKRLEAAPNQEKKTWWKWPTFAAAAAGVCVLVIGLSVFMRSKPPRHHESSVTQIEIARHLELFEDYEVVANLDLLEDENVISELEALTREKP